MPNPVGRGDAGDQSVSRPKGAPIGRPTAHEDRNGQDGKCGKNVRNDAHLSLSSRHPVGKDAWTPGNRGSHARWMCPRMTPERDAVLKSFLIIAPAVLTRRACWGEKRRERGRLGWEGPPPSGRVCCLDGP